MNEEAEILLGKAIRGVLDTAGQERWNELCSADPSVQKEARELIEVADRLHEQAQPAGVAPGERIEAPPAVLERLEAARKEVFELSEIKSKNQESSRASRPSILQSLSESVRNLVEFPVPLLAAAAAVAILAAGWWFWQSGGRPGPVIATFKNAAINPDLPIASPGDATLLTDPPILWMTLDPSPVTVTVLDATSGVVLYHLEKARPPVRWENLVPTDAVRAPAPGEKFLVRLQLGETESSRVVHVEEGARALSSWVETDPSAGRALAETWLKEGRAADALALASALAAAHKDTAAGFTDLRTRALKQALADSPEP